jgi:hypothetical protein
MPIVQDLERGIDTSATAANRELYRMKKKFQADFEKLARERFQLPEGQLAWTAGSNITAVQQLPPTRAERLADAPRLRAEGRARAEDRARQNEAVAADAEDQLAIDEVVEDMVQEAENPPAEEAVVPDAERGRRGRRGVHVTAHDGNVGTLKYFGAAGDHGVNITEWFNTYVGEILIEDLEPIIQRLSSIKVKLSFNVLLERPYTTGGIFRIEHATVSISHPAYQVITRSDLKCERYCRHESHGRTIRSMAMSRAPADGTSWASRCASWNTFSTIHCGEATHSWKCRGTSR